MLKELGATDFTVAIFKIPQISKHFSAMLQFRQCSEETHFLTYQVVKNIKLPVTFRESSVSISYNFFEIDTMKRS